MKQSPVYRVALYSLEIASSLAMTRGNVCILCFQKEKYIKTTCYAGFLTPQFFLQFLLKSISCDRCLRMKSYVVGCA